MQIIKPVLVGLGLTAQYEQFRKLPDMFRGSGEIQAKRGEVAPAEKLEGEGNDATRASDKAHRFSVESGIFGKITPGILGIANRSSHQGRYFAASDYHNAAAKMHLEAARTEEPDKAHLHRKASVLHKLAADINRKMTGEAGTGTTHYSESEKDKLASSSYYPEKPRGGKSEGETGESRSLHANRLYTEANQLTAIANASSRAADSGKGNHFVAHQMHKAAAEIHKHLRSKLFHPAPGGLDYVESMISHHTQQAEHHLKMHGEHKDTSHSSLKSE